MSMKKWFIFNIILLALPSLLWANVYKQPPSDQSLIGDVQYITTQPNDKIFSIQQHFDVGYNAMKAANPHLDLLAPMLPNTTIVIPMQHLLPSEPRNGIVINLPEMRIYYYLSETNDVLTYPVGIGKIGNMIPITKTVIKRKTENPSWIPTAQIREFNLKNGITLPTVMPAGPDNPLGPYAIYTGIPTYLMHSTIYPDSIGTRASFGCIRMYLSDIEELFQEVSPGTPLSIIDMPVKIGFQENRLYMEAYPPLEEHRHGYGASLPSIVYLIENNTRKSPVLVDWQLVSFLNEERDGMPHEIGTKLLLQ
ncbi:MAG: hypothetical protein A3F43_03325 [Gammaproteobacteria bacterium RIFCSPHIGHO2_12_FULL_42_10]|nr:MAG: hypothetical protein A3F43_03325 [Gammaproteobacteria bacterium RIFCSPHIGHO2_12_FULL_42_10]